ncbi:UNVERIFIED_CONTAM: hypothetical protein GTU68_064066, partial [Idotea baltica]|nr:hypothetical protein [Idotea baltica]
HGHVRYFDFQRPLTLIVSVRSDSRVASTQFSPTDARRAFPCFDEPGFKATFNIAIERDAGKAALSNMPLLSTSPIVGQEGRFVDRFERTLKMSTYLVGFLVSDFVSLSSDALNHTEFRVWSREEAINQTAFALKVGPQLLLYLEDYFGVTYPLPKLDMAAIPNFKFNGMENWGLIMYRESAMLFDPVLSTISDKRAILSVIAHEIAHMWFGNLVTPKWWSELWLKEGFANFMGYKAIDYVSFFCKLPIKSWLKIKRIKHK